MSDTVTLSIPRNPQYYSVARLVVGGLAAGLSVSYDALDDLQLAIGSLLDSDDLPADGDLQIKLDVDDSTLTATLGRFRNDSLAAALQGNGKGPELGLRRLLDTIVDTVEIEAAEGGDGEWVRLTKKVETAGGAKAGGAA